MQGTRYHRIRVKNFRSTACDEEVGLAFEAWLNPNGLESRPGH